MFRCLGVQKVIQAHGKQCNSVFVLREYHAKHGVFGYRPKKAPKEEKVSNKAFQNRIHNANLLRLVSAYRDHGHKRARIDPLGLNAIEEIPSLNPELYGFSGQDSTRLDLQGILHTWTESATITDILKHLEDIYCGPLAVEFHQLVTEEEKEWFSRQLEQQHGEALPVDRRKELAKILLESQVFDNFMATKFTTVKRYGGEGAESMMGFFDQVFRQAAEDGIQDVVLGMPHRGRLNLLAGMLNFPPELLFRKMRGLPEFPDGVQGSGDVLSHLTASTDLQYDDKSVHVTMIPNPSHLEACNPVAAGKTRAAQLHLREWDYSQEEGDSQQGDKVLCLQIHGDAAFTSQGVVAETLGLADLPHFHVGGTVHLIANNQLGFTTGAERGRSSRYSSDIAKMIDCAVIHVNGDYPEEVIKATKLAMSYRQTFRRDVIVDMLCFRRWGHNELDDPSFTQPVMYKVIRGRYDMGKSVPDVYAEQLVNDGLLTKEDVAKINADCMAKLGDHFSRLDSFPPQARHLQKQWTGLVQASSQITTWDTGVDANLLKYVGAKSVEVPSDLAVHPHLQKTLVDVRKKKMEVGTGLDWATAEALAVGSLLYQGFNVRISGQDVGRGTFSHRHFMLIDQDDDRMHIPLNDISDNQSGYLEVANSCLSEEAVLGFEYGMSIESPQNLIIWEAQFGDFFNGAQVIIDTFVSSGETKWLLQSGLTILLPHGMDGAGPEHSSCRIERWLQLCDSKEDGVDGDNVNMQLVNPTTPAQYFHLIRRQMVRNFRKPLVVVGPKILLRLPAATSTLEDMAPGTFFKPVLGDQGADPTRVTRVVFCSGKHYYGLAKEREARGAAEVAIIRIEELCPFPMEAIREEMKKYSKATEFIWSQEEHRNMGAWSFIHPRFENLLACKLKYAGRGTLATPAVGVGEVHQAEAKQVITDAFA
ncbi:PREDICTED: probable 2-oxoglutarate dehydrogenase E1 component DHKTD1, mitochondrial [Branchiostoma belcheri]|uniref:2-oxoadipate dehydrogenase complex component E1 n=1 Tax=Branchiostoma belcheri TaxID=7741 RepID=A0A6P4ZCM3_BRABE|nr:PREDICTED: probable 2-oxoglutarate dehydrogenase E1 component DHKTD1, mitochondrial [Branchiostoma belcheri]